MKKKMILGSIAISLLLTSCVTQYNTIAMKSNFDYLMDGKKNQEIVKTYSVYLSDAEIKGSFEVISINEWNPFTFLFWHGVKRFKRYTLKKAVLSAKDQKGNGVIILDQRHWKVIKMNQ